MTNIINPELEATDLETYASKLFRQSCTFLRSVPSIPDLPPISLSEVAFAGRSNVGKSSLINALVSRNKLAHASNTPGRTQFLNFYNLGNTLFMVDLPGYGYANAPKAMVENWTRLIVDYLKGRPCLKRVFLLVDSRHGIKAGDLEIMELLDTCAVSYQIVLTKTDKISAPALKAIHEAVSAEAEKHGAAYPVILATSSQKGTGLDSLRMAVASLVFSKSVSEGTN